MKHDPRNRECQGLRPSHNANISVAPAFARKVRARPSGLSTFEAIWVHLRYGPATRSPSLKMASSMGFRMLSFLPSCHSSYGAWTLTPVGLSPTDHASLRWTHRLSVQIGRASCRERV